ncbi:DUF4342 domain-containing protein [Candidatus Shapirobacteria bacterium]|jgi:uncharacterized membrane protein YqjE|nr:DUF4342 domain-containing protein [Candidatus Shapirobacteria bacterium]
MKKNNKKEVKIERKKVINETKNLIKEGQIRNLIIENKEGKEVIVIPLLLAIIITIILPPLAIVGLIITLLLEGTIKVRKG